MSKIFGACGGPRRQARSARKRQKFSGSLRSPALIFRISYQIETLIQILGLARGHLDLHQSKWRLTRGRGREGGRMA